MAQLPQLSQQAQDALKLQGYDGKRIYQINKLPSYAIPRTTAYNLTTAAVAGLSLLGYIVTKRNNLYSLGFAVTFGLTFALDFAHRRQLDRTSVLSTHSFGSLEFQLEKHPQFKKAFETVDAELDAKIADLELQLQRTSEAKFASRGSRNTTNSDEN